MKKIQVGSYDEWLKMALNQKFTISQTIVESILDNIDTKRKKLPIFEVEVESKGDKKINAFEFKTEGSVKRPGVHSKTKASSHKKSKNYKKAYRGQGR